MCRRWWLGLVIVAACATGEDAGQNAGDSAGDSVIIIASVGEEDFAAPSATVGPAEPQPVTTASADHGPRTALPPNEHGRIPILEYHLMGPTEGRWTRSPEGFRKDLELLYNRGYRPVTLRDVKARRLTLPVGTSPVVFTFDDASPGQFRYIERTGELQIDPTSAVGIWLDFARAHPGWDNKAVFCLLSGAEAGRSFFGNKDIEGQKTEWRHRKVKFLADQGFELCNHTLWHATLSNAKYSDAFVQEQIARLQLAVDSAVPGYRLRTLALPLGEWPKNRDLARAGSWTDPKTGRTTSYEHDTILQVAGGPARSPHDPTFDSLRLPRVQVFATELQTVLDRLDRERSRYVSDGDTTAVARPQQTP
jgi:hypothetical protein